MNSNQGGKHIWTTKQDNILVQCLVEMKIDGKYMVDNGFRPGYLNHIEDYINERVPGCGIKGIPHIQSRLKTLKATWKLVYNMVHGPNTSGFSWNPDTQTVTAPNVVWNEYLKSHKKAALFRFRSFPNFENLCIVWAKDKTFGRDVKTIADILNTDANSCVGEGTNSVENMDMKQDDEPNFIFSEEPSTSSTKVTSSSRKRWRNDADSLMEALSNGFDLMEKGFKEATTEIVTQLRRFAHKANLTDKREKLWEELTKVPGFTKEEMAKAAKMIGKDDSMLIMFPTLPLNVKAIVIRDYIN